MSARARQWSIAYAKQAKCDLDAFLILQREQGFPPSQELYFLRMACEKLVKSHRCRRDRDILPLQKHVAIGKVLPTIVMEEYRRVNREKFPGQTRILERLQALAIEIDQLLPRGEFHGGRPDNCEYPWEDRNQVHTPCEHEFSVLDPLASSIGVLLLKFLPSAIAQAIA